MFSIVCVSSSITVLQSMKLGIDVNRHKEIIVKAISALLLLLLKHFKLNHIYQVTQTHRHLTSPSFSPLTLSSFFHLTFPPSHTYNPCTSPPALTSATLHLIIRSSVPLLFLYSSSSPPPPFIWTSILTPHNLLQQCDMPTV